MFLLEWVVFDDRFFVNKFVEFFFWFEEWNGNFEDEIIVLWICIEFFFWNIRFGVLVLYIILDIWRFCWKWEKVFILYFFIIFFFLFCFLFGW